MATPANNMISKSDDASSTKNKFLQQARQARLARELCQKQDSSAAKLQAFFKSIHCRHRLKIDICNELDSILSDKLETSKQDTHPKEEKALLNLIRRIIFLCDRDKDKNITDKLIQVIHSRLELANDKTNLNDELTSKNNSNDDIAKDESGAATANGHDLSPSTGRKTIKFDNILIEQIQSESDLKQLMILVKFVTNICLDRIIELVDTKSSAGLDKNKLISDCLTIVNSLIDLDSNYHATKASDDCRKRVENLSNEIIKQTIDKKKNILEYVGSIITENKRFNSDASNRLLVNFVKLFCKITDLNTKSCQTTKDSSKRYIMIKELVVNMKRFLTVPAIILILEDNSPKDLDLVNKKGIFLITLSTLTCHFDLIHNDITSIQALCILANMIHLSSLNENIMKQYLIDFCGLMSKLLQLCRKNCAPNCPPTKWNDLIISTDSKSHVINLKSTKPKDVSYNPILGWLERDKDMRLDKGQLMKQVGKLWTARYLGILFAELLKTNEDATRPKQTSTAINETGTNRDNNNQPTNVRDGDNQQRLEICEDSPSLITSINMFKKLTRWKTTSQQAIIENTAILNPRHANSFLGYYGRPKFLGGSGASKCKLLTPEAQRIGAICQFLLEAIENLSMIRQDILTNICMHHYILLELWTFIKSLGPNNGLQAYLELLPLTRKSLCTPGINDSKLQSQPHTQIIIGEFHILSFFCECASNLINVLDESELYDLHKPFKYEDLLAISSFMNNLVYQLLSFNCSSDSSNSMELFGVCCDNPTMATAKSEVFTKLLRSPHKLLKDLYTRDCRRKFAPKDHWFIKELKVSSFLKDIEAKKLTAFKVLQMIPHIIPHKERVLIFRKFVSMDKLLARPSTLISIHRSRIVEDGYQQLARLAPDALKGLIRVKFINDFGLGEAGIDQDGVFKEFLEDTMTRVFDPALNLFKTTSEQCLYPSPTSCLHENYESLFNFVGKMLAKAVYEGIMVDLPFAPFFLRRVVGQPQNALYSPLDELPSLDPELFKSLTYIKHYEGDVSELALTFCIDQDFMGKIETHELEPGGRSTPVTRENRVRYIHLVADFHLRKQIARQTHAFIRGFQSIIEPGWLTMFSAIDLQNLISGENTPIDLHDLRKNTKYSGGFHNHHRVISWLWDILDKDFTPEEHKLFLKFITSCSKPPLLGFSHLEPPFSIRCIEVSDDLDLGDTLGSIVRGFLAIRRSDPVDRLPTSSTCFNLLKLPNYQRRSTLKEKLRYAIHSNAGFELS